MNIEKKIISEARRLGFGAAGIAAAGPSETIDLFKEWLDKGYAAGMDYLASRASLRSDPRKLASGTGSVIVIAARYPVNKSPGTGFSCYARGRDYHTVLRKKLGRLAEFIKNETNISVARICVDSSPILEREWAVRAGIAWRGKQGQVVNPELGCCFFLGELLVDAGLESSEQIPGQCGNCRRCIDACPTGAVDERGFVDARKCISYLTIEHKGDIPENMRPLIGKALFGCDICTVVCPWNRLDNDSVMSEFRERDMPGAEQCACITDEDFNTRFNDSPVLRGGPECLRRNAAIALANANSV